MKLYKHKFIIGFLVFVLMTGAGLGAAVWKYGNLYAKQAAVYVKTLNWVVPLSTKYIRIAADEETGMFRGRTKEYLDVINTDGEVIKSQKLTEYVFESEPLGENLTTFEENYSIGAKDQNGNIVIPATHQSILPFEDGYCIALKEDGYEAIYDVKGRLLKDGYGDLFYLTNDKFACETDSHYEIFDLRTGKTWDNYKGRAFSEVFRLDEQTFAIGFPSQTSELYRTDYVLFDGNMEPMLDEKTFTFVGGLSEGMRYFITSDRTFDGEAAKEESGFMNEEGETVFIFDHVPECANDYKDGLALVYDDQLYAVDKEGRKVFSLEYTGDKIGATRTHMYEHFDVGNIYYTEYQESVAPFTLDGKNWGYIDKRGKVVIEPVFKSVSPIYHGYAVVCGTGAIGPSSIVNSRWGIIDLREVLKDVQ